jgi:hypothetical protein
LTRSFRDARIGTVLGTGGPAEGPPRHGENTMGWQSSYSEDHDYSEDYSEDSWDGEGYDEQDEDGGEDFDSASFEDDEAETVDDTSDDGGCDDDYYAA